MDGYTEKGHDAHAMWFGSQQRKALISTLGWRLQGSLTLHQASLKPFVELAANRDSKANPGNPRKITARSSTMGGRFQMPGFVPDKTWLTTDIGVSAMFNNITTRLAYSGHFNDKHQKYSSINLGLKLGF